MCNQASVATSRSRLRTAHGVCATEWSTRAAWIGMCCSHIRNPAPAPTLRLQCIRSNAKP